MSDVASSLAWCSIGIVDGDVGIPLRPYLSRRLQDKPSCLVFKGGNVDLLFDE